MYLSTERILARRHSVLILLRLLCLALFIIGSIWVIMAIVQTAVWGFSSNWPRGARESLLFTFGGRIGVAAACLLPAAVLLGLNKSLAKWLVPLPRLECPSCGYGLDRLSVKVCPECGAQLAPPVSET